MFHHFHLLMQSKTKTNCASALWKLIYFYFILKALLTDLIMFHVKIMTPRRPSKQTAAAASKIKNKLLSESITHHLDRKMQDDSSPWQILTFFSSQLCTRHFLLLLQSVSEEQQQGLGSCFGGAEGAAQAAWEGDRVPPETSGGPVLWVGLHKIQAQEIGWFAFNLNLFPMKKYSSKHICLKSVNFSSHTHWECSVWFGGWLQHFFPITAPDLEKPPQQHFAAFGHGGWLVHWQCKDFFSSESIKIYSILKSTYIL